MLQAIAGRPTEDYAQCIHRPLELPVSHMLQFEMQNRGLLEAVDDAGTKEGLPLHGNAIKNGPGQVSIEVDLTSRTGLVHSIPGRPHRGLHTKSMSKAK